MDITILTLDTAIDGQSETQVVAIGTLTRTLGFLVQPPMVGYVALRHTGRKIASFRHLYVFPPARRNGVAQQLITVCSDLARKSGCAGINLMLNPRNGPAHCLYGKLGFKPVMHYDDGDFQLYRDL